MSEYIGKNIQGDTNYNDLGNYYGEGGESEKFQNLQKCFEEVFGLSLVLNNSNFSYFEAYIQNGVPTIVLNGKTGVELNISDSELSFNGIIRMRRVGSNNTDMQERTADEAGTVILQGGSASYGGANAYYYFGEVAIGQSPMRTYLGNMNPSQAHGTCDPDETIEPYSSNILKLSSQSLALGNTKVNNKLVKGSHILQIHQQTPGDVDENSGYGFIDSTQTTLGRYWHFCDYIYDYHNMSDQGHRTIVRCSGNGLLIEQKNANGETVTTTTLQHPYGIAVVGIPPLNVNIEYNCPNRLQKEPCGYYPEDAGGGVVRASETVGNCSIDEHYYYCDLGTYEYSSPKYYTRSLDAQWQIDSNEFDSQYDGSDKGGEKIGTDTDHWLNKICDVKCTSITLGASISSVYDDLSFWLTQNGHVPPELDLYDRCCFYNEQYFTASMYIEMTLNNIPSIVAKQSYAGHCEIDYGMVAGNESQAKGEIGVPAGFNVTGPSFSSSGGKGFRTDVIEPVNINSSAQCSQNYSYNFGHSSLKAKGSNIDGGTNNNGRSNGFYCIVVWGVN